MTGTDRTAAQGPPAARVVHRARGRLRLRIPARRHDKAFFAALEQRLAQVPKIEAALANPRTASVLLRFTEGDGDGIAAAVNALEILSLAPGSGPSRRLDAVAAGPANARRALDSVDRRKLAFAIFVLLLIRRLSKGGYLAPGLALLWLLYELWQGPGSAGEGPDEQA